MMAGVKSIAVEVEGARDLALVANNGAVWLVVPVRWWDLATLVWWVFCPADRRARVKVQLTDGSWVSCKAVRVASKHIGIRGFG